MAALLSTVFCSRSIRRSRRILSIEIGRSLTVRSGSGTAVLLAVVAFATPPFPGGCAQSEDPEKATEAKHTAEMRSHRRRLRAIRPVLHGLPRVALNV